MKMHLTKLFFFHLIIISIFSLDFMMAQGFGGEPDLPTNQIQSPVVERKEINTPAAPVPVGSYSQGVLVGNTLYTSGQIGMRPSGVLVNSSIEDETEQAIKNLVAILEAAGMGLGDVVRTNVYMSDITLFKKINKVYGTYFSENLPARETMEVSGLPMGARVEISLIAVKTNSR